MLRVDGAVMAVQLLAVPPLTLQVKVPEKAGLPEPPVRVAMKVSGVPITTEAVGSLKVRVGVRAARLTVRLAVLVV